MSTCHGSYKPATATGECPDCGRRFAREDRAGDSRRNVPLHSPDMPPALEAFRYERTRSPMGDFMSWYCNGGRS